jgi:hypothetical protein
MDILSNRARKLLRDSKLRDKIDELLREGEMCVTVVVDDYESHPAEGAVRESKQIIVRRLVA